MNILRDTIEEALKDVHIETGRVDQFEKVVNKIEVLISEKVLLQEIDVYSEMYKDFSDYDLSWV